MPKRGVCCSANVAGERCFQGWDDCPIGGALKARQHGYLVSLPLQVVNGNHAPPITWFGESL